MLAVLNQSWALLLGMLLLLLGNGLQTTVLGIRGSIEGFNAETMSYVMSGYFVGFLAGSYRAPGMIRRVGHVRVFAALASLISAAFILYPAVPEPLAWTAMRMIVGFCFAGVYVVAESWLNAASTNETRGQTLSLYMLTQIVGIIASQAFVTLADPSGYALFIVMSVLVSVAFTPILLTPVAAPAYQAGKRMSLGELFRISPLGCVGTFLLGGVFAGIFSMSSVFGAEKGLSVSQIALFVAISYTGGLVFQFPIGWVSDRMDRRLLIMGLTAFGAVFTFAGMFFTGHIAAVMAIGFVLGAVANPLYALIIAYTNDFLDAADMAAASGGLLFIHGVGAAIGPILIGSVMQLFGADAFFAFVGGCLALIATYAAWRMTQRAAPTAAETSSYAPMLATATPVAVEAALSTSDAPGR
ncbi:MFS transporter [Amaricoccus sp.]|uniref:MFS transporter n=1 Tax=Amaricoccus sp. TaxID=1872485 RepID=UPI001B4D7006|nr:MFS transporter [Amaricoccus sp.]MBP7240954.1 MFS transporter [Amaricoccus sp.]